MQIQQNKTTRSVASYNTQLGNKLGLLGNAPDSTKWWLHRDHTPEILPVYFKRLTASEISFVQTKWLK